MQNQYPGFDDDDDDDDGDRVGQSNTSEARSLLTQFFSKIMHNI